MRSLISAFKYWLQRSYLCSQSYTRGVMEIQMLLVLVAASWMCCGAAQKDELYDDLMDDYVKEVEPPLPEGAQNITFKMSLDLRCATPAFDGLVSIESWTVVVRKVGVWLRVDYMVIIPPTKMCTYFIIIIIIIIIIIVVMLIC